MWQPASSSVIIIIGSIRSIRVRLQLEMAGVLLDVATFDRTWVYLAIHASTATLTAETVLISPTENTPTTESADVALAITGCTDDCNNHGSCIDAACICYSGFSGATCAVKVVA